MKRKKIIYKIEYILGLICILLLFTSCEQQKIILTTGFKDGEIFRLEDESCFDKEIYVYLANTKETLSDTFGEEILNTTFDIVSFGDSLPEMILGRLCKVKMMDLMAKKKGIKLGDNEKTAMRSAAREYYQSIHSLDKAYFKNITENDLIRMYEDIKLSEKLYESLAMEIDSEISDDEARTIVVKRIVLHTKHKNENGEYVSISDEEINSKRSTAQSVLTLFNNGTGFEELLLQYSEEADESLYYSANELSDELHSILFSLGEGEVSDIRSEDDGFYISYLEDPEYSSLTEDTKKEILEEKRKKAFDESFESFSMDRKCYMNDKLWEDTDWSVVETKGSGFFDIYNKYNENMEE